MIIRRTSLFRLLWLGSALLAGCANFPPAPDSLTAWARQSAIPLRTVDPTGDLEDLDAFGRVVGDAGVVALGEATHGTHEFFVLKHRLIRYLVVQKGFTRFAIEANAPEARALDAYIQGGPGDPRELLVGLHFWTWDTRELLELIAWMRDYDARVSPDRRVHFVGFDLQFSAQALSEVEATLGKLDPALHDALLPQLSPLRSDARVLPPPHWSDPEIRAVDAAISRAGERLAHASSGAEVSPAELAVAQADVRELRQAWRFKQLSSADEVRASLARDQMMAENVLQIAGEGKTVIWAHDLHVDGDSNGGVYLSMGTRLRKALGAKLLLCGLFASEGQFRSRDLRYLRSPLNGISRFQVGEAPEGSVEQALRTVGEPLFALDVRHPPAGASDWLGGEHPYRSVGSMYATGQEDAFQDFIWLNKLIRWVKPEYSPVTVIHPDRSFDVLFFVHRASAAEPNATLLYDSDGARIAHFEADGTARDEAGRVLFRQDGDWIVDGSGRVIARVEREAPVARVVAPGSPRTLGQVTYDGAFHVEDAAGHHWTVGSEGAITGSSGPAGRFLGTGNAPRDVALWLILRSVTGVSAAAAAR